MATYDELYSDTFYTGSDNWIAFFPKSFSDNFFLPVDKDVVSFFFSYRLFSSINFSSSFSFQLTGKGVLTDKLPLGDGFLPLGIYTKKDERLFLLDDFNVITDTKLISDFYHFSENYVLLSPGAIYDLLSFSDIFSAIFSLKARDQISLFDLWKISYSLTFKDILRLLTSLEATREISVSLADVLDFLVSFYTSLDVEGTLLFVLSSFLTKEALFWTVYLTNIGITGIDGIITAKDGIYIFSDENVKGDVVFNLSNFDITRLKRIDKIYADIDLEEADVYADGDKYTFSGSRWINCAKGLTAKDLKVWLKNLDQLEFATFRIVPLIRAKR